VQFGRNYPETKGSESLTFKVEHSTSNIHTEELLLELVKKELEQFGDGDECACAIASAAQEWAEAQIDLEEKGLTTPCCHLRIACHER
jgi:hypothetical protein